MPISLEDTLHSAISRKVVAYRRAAAVAIGVSVVVGSGPFCQWLFMPFFTSVAHTLAERYAMTGGSLTALLRGAGLLGWITAACSLGFIGRWLVLTVANSFGWNVVGHSDLEKLDYHGTSPDERALQAVIGKIYSELGIYPLVLKTQGYAHVMEDNRSLFKCDILVLDEDRYFPLIAGLTVVWQLGLGLLASMLS